MAAQPASRMAAQPTTGMEAAQPTTGMEAAQPATGVEGAQPPSRMAAAQSASGVEAAQPPSGMAAAQSATGVEAAPTNPHGAGWCPGLLVVRAQLAQPPAEPRQRRRRRDGACSPNSHLSFCSLRRHIQPCLLDSASVMTFRTAVSACLTWLPVMNVWRSGVSAGMHASWLKYYGFCKKLRKASAWHNPDMMSSCRTHGSSRAPSVTAQTGLHCCSSRTTSPSPATSTSKVSLVSCQASLVHAGSCLVGITKLPCAECRHHRESSGARTPRCSRMLTSQGTVLQMTERPRPMCWRTARGTCSWRGRRCA